MSCKIPKNFNYFFKNFNFSGENKYFTTQNPDKIAKISRSNSTIFERISKIEDGINYQNQQIAKLQSNPVPVNDYDIYDGSEETLDNLPPSGLTERMKILENRFKEIQWDLDTVIQQEDDKDLNGTREELEQLNYKVDLIETQLEKHGYSHIQTTLEGTFQ